MGAEMFGAPVGISQRREDDNRDALAGFKALDTMSEMSMRPAQLENLRAQAAFHFVQAAKGQQELVTQQKVAQEMSGLAAQQGFKPSTDPADMLDQQGQAYLRAGDMANAQKSFNTASQMRARATTAEMNVQRGEYFHEQSLLAPERLAASQQAHQDTQQYRSARLQQIDRQIAERASRRGGADASGKAALREAQIALIEARRQKLLQNDGPKGGGGAASANDKEVARAVDQLKGAGLDLGEDQISVASSIADEAKARVKANKGLDISKAIGQIIEENRKAGAFATTPKYQIPRIGGVGKKTVMLGQSKDKPIPTIPKNPSTKKWYATPKGPLRYLGNDKWTDDEEDD